jgi:hypothetical protein
MYKYVVKEKGRGIRTKVLFMHFLENTALQSKTIYFMVSDGAHTTGRFRLDTSPILLAELHAPECTSADSEKESCCPDAGDDETNGEEC